MPELPDVSVYVEALQARLLGQPLQKLRLTSPFVLRTFDPTPQALEGKHVQSIRRLGKRIVFEFDGELFLIIHLMIAGRFRWLAPGAKMPGKLGLAALDFPNGTLVLTEAGSKRRASMHIVRGAEAVRAHDPGGIEVLDIALDDFARALTRERHTLKRTLTDPHVFSGIGNAYSDEILHVAKMSPFKIANTLTDTDVQNLYDAMIGTLREATADAGDLAAGALKAHKKETMRVHGRTGQACPICGDTIREVSFADSSLQYCPTCQTGGKPLADRRMSKLLK